MRPPHTSPERWGSDEFWDDFVDAYWERRPTVIKGSGVGILDEARVMRAVLRCIEAAGAAATEAIYLRGEEGHLDTSIRALMPTDADRDLSSYVARATRKLGSEQFGITVPALHGHLEWADWHRFRCFLKGLYDRVGVASRNAELVMFAGSSKTSERGVHMDTAEVFQFVISGKKRIRAWPREVFEGYDKWTRLGPRDYARYNDRSICLDAGPGDIIFWPSSYWHVGEASGRTISCSLSLAVHYGTSALRGVGAVLEQEAARSLRQRGRIASLPASPARAARKLEGVNAAIRAAAHGVDFEERQLRRLLGQMTGYAFGAIPVFPAPRGLRGEDLLRVDPAFPIVHLRRGKRLFVSAGGHVESVPYSAGLEALLRKLNRGRPHRAGELAGTSKPTFALLALLQRRGAFVEVAPMRHAQ